MEILELSVNDGLKRVATWDPEHGVITTRLFSDMYSQISASLQNKTLSVAAKTGMPFLRWKYDFPLWNFSDAANDN